MRDDTWEFWTWSGSIIVAATGGAATGPIGAVVGRLIGCPRGTVVGTVVGALVAAAAGIFLFYGAIYRGW